MGNPQELDATQALERLTTELARAPFHEFLRPTPVRVDLANGSVEITVAFRPEFARAYDVADWHGGVIAAIIDICGHAAIAVSTGRVSPTIDLRIDYIAAARGDLSATGRPIRIGRSIGRADIEVRDASGRVIAVGRGAFSTLSESR